MFRRKNNVRFSFFARLLLRGFLLFCFLSLVLKYLFFGLRQISGRPRSRGASSTPVGRDRGKAHPGTIGSSRNNSVHSSPALSTMPVPVGNDLTDADGMTAMFPSLDLGGGVGSSGGGGGDGGGGGRGEGAAGGGGQTHGPSGLGEFLGVY